VALWTLVRQNPKQGREWTERKDGEGKV